MITFTSLTFWSSCRATTSFGELKTILGCCDIPDWICLHWDNTTTPHSLLLSYFVSRFAIKSVGSYSWIAVFLTYLQTLCSVHSCSFFVLNVWGWDKPIRHSSKCLFQFLFQQMIHHKNTIVIIEIVN